MIIIITISSGSQPSEEILKLSNTPLSKQLTKTNKQKHEV
jgi:hypothetical protein